MSARAIRRAAERHALKLARKASDTPAATIQITELTAEPASHLSPARAAANQANAQLSSGPITPQGKAISAQNHTIHGLARHNGEFKLLATEDPAAFEAFKQDLASEHQPATQTEALLINALAESHWLAQRAQRLLSRFIDPDTGLITNEKTFSLYLRYETTHTRAFYKALHELQALKAHRRKTEIGFEAQKARQETRRLAAEQHEMKKDKHYWEVLRKDGEACAQLSRNTVENIKAAAENPGFEAQYAAQLAGRGLTQGVFRAGVKAAAA